MDGLAGTVPPAPTFKRNKDMSIDKKAVARLAADWEAGKEEAGDVAFSILRQIADGRIPVEIATPETPSITITAEQLRWALEFVNPDGPKDKDQMETEVTIWFREKDEVSPDEGEPLPRGLYCHLTEYPEEGCIPLFEVPANVEVRGAEQASPAERPS
jgi:hypothetical protein